MRPVLLCNCSLHNNIYNRGQQGNIIYHHLLQTLITPKHKEGKTAMVWKKWTVYAKKYYLEALKLKENECIPHFTGQYILGITVCCLLELPSHLREVSQCMEKAFSLLKAPNVLINKLLIVRVLVGASNKEMKLRKLVDCCVCPPPPHCSGLLCTQTGLPTFLSMSYHQCCKTIHRFHNRFSQSRRRPLIGPSPG